MRIGTMGPEGTFSDAAAKKLAPGKRAVVVYFANIHEIFDAMYKGEIDAAVVPVENSSEGTVGATVDNLYRHTFLIRDEAVIDVHHSLAVLPHAGKISRVVSHPQALAQCSQFLYKRFPGAVLVPASSTVGAMEQVMESGEKETAVVGPEEAAKRLGLRIIARNIEDEPYNKTRFFLVGKRDQPGVRKAKTSMILHEMVDRPGLLYDVLGEFAKRGINLTKIESRPAKKRLGKYFFVIDFEGSRLDKKVKEALDGLKKFVSVKMLGTYPKRY